MSDRLDSLEELWRAAHELLNDKRLDVSVITPLLSSLLDTYINESRTSSYGDVCKLLKRIEMQGYPQLEIHKLAKQAEDRYGHILGDTIRQAIPGLALDDECDGLRQSIRYAAMVAEKEAEESGADACQMSVATP